MGKKPFTTRIDEEVLAVAQRLADIERRSVTSLIEIAVLAYAAGRGALPQMQDGTSAQHVSPQESKVTDGPGTKVARKKRLA
jgi:hypothetical protein